MYLALNEYLFYSNYCFYNQHTTKLWHWVTDRVAVAFPSLTLTLTAITLWGSPSTHINNAIVHRDKWILWEVRGGVACMAILYKFITPPHGQTRYAIFRGFVSFVSGVRIAQWLKNQTCDWKVMGSNPDRCVGRIFFSRVNFLCWIISLSIPPPRYCSST